MIDLKRLRDFLRSIEFRGEGEHCQACLSCYRCMHDHGGRKGHDEKCELLEILREVERELGESGGR